jgi:hypothetical protein
MSRLKILKILVAIIIFICLLFTFSFLTACREKTTDEKAEPVEEVLEEEAEEEAVEEETEEIIEDEVEEPEQTASDETLSSCYNSYFPVKENMIWNYNLQSPDIESFDYSLSFINITDNSFSQVVTFEGGTIESEWTCSELGILQSVYRELNFAEAGAGQVELETIGVEGITFPPEDELNIGKTWKVVYDTKGKIKAGDTEIEAAVKVEMEYEIISIEDVEVTAGNYSDALNIANKVTLNISSDFLNTTISSDSNSWFARDIGLVKNVGSLEETQTITELISLE